MRKNRIKIIPKPPKPEEIDSKAKEYLEEWLAYFKKLSTRIIIKLPTDEGFDLNFYESKTRESLSPADNTKIIDWPNLESIAFLVSFNSSFPGHKPIFLVKNTCIFCFNNVAFTLNHFEMDEEVFDEGKNEWIQTYSLYDYKNIMSALSWKYIAEKFIKNPIEEIENSVPKL